MRRSWLKIATCLFAGLYLAPAANSMQWPRGAAAPLSLLQRAPAQLAQAKPEEVIVAALNAIRQNRLSEADRLVDALLDVRPNYRLAHLLKGDLLMARAQPLAGIGSAPIVDDKLNDLREEASVRMARYNAPPPLNEIPSNLLQLTNGQRFAVVVDASKSRLYLFRNDGGVPRYVLDFYVTIGKLGFDKSREGDQRTPLGVYFVTGHLPREQLDKNYGQRAQLYGVGAWPISYPNDWDRQQGRTGSGIWLHGVPYDTYSRAPKASNGCVAMSNTDMTALGSYLQANTPVVIASSVEWLSSEVWQQRREAALNKLENWRRDWESLNAPRYLAHYAGDFRSGNNDLARWKAQKIAVNAGKQWARIRLEDLSVFSYPSREGNLLMADFAQDYKSSNLENRSQKRLYFRRQADDWKIIYEAAAG
ncbi:L,D-transpeptidase family protein [Chitinimonas arctica]|uniref:L,D-transpeptidase family protein n=1 Tax=Chitinimonas arctica TaxID=2594795 RepID=A0A516SCU1_9NEIS|nr:L,D-transpeptidase family protein [Chitinimonas arctica]QDQ25868.1 L,D-transpeptidase family protein [Chitinimonas arctica]